MSLFWVETVRLNGTAPPVFKCASTVDQFKRKKLMPLPVFISSVDPKISKLKKKRLIQFVKRRKNVFIPAGYFESSTQNTSFKRWMII